jgi:hypothetical protein
MNKPTKFYSDAADSKLIDLDGFFTGPGLHYSAEFSAG